MLLVFAPKMHTLIIVVTCTTLAVNKLIIAAGALSAAQAFSFNSLAQAAGVGLPQLRPMPRGATNLEEIERRQSGNLETSQPSSVGPIYAYAHGGIAATSADAEAAVPQRNAGAGAPGPTQSPFSYVAADQPSQSADSSRALLDMLSSIPVATSRAAAVAPPPGFVGKGSSAISWGSASSLQEIWGAPTSTPGVAGKPDWGPPPSASPAPLQSSGAFASSAQPGVHQLLHQQQPRAQQEAAGSQLDHRLLFPTQGSSMPFSNNAAAPFNHHLDQFSRAQEQQALAALSNRDSGAANLSQQDSSVNRAVDAAQNPLLALLGRHNASATTGNHAMVNLV